MYLIEGSITVRSNLACATILYFLFAFISPLRDTGYNQWVEQWNKGLLDDINIISFLLIFTNCNGRLYSLFDSIKEITLNLDDLYKYWISAIGNTLYVVAYGTSIIWFRSQQWIDVHNLLILVFIKIMKLSPFLFFFLNY